MSGKLLSQRRTFERKSVCLEFKAVFKRFLTVFKHDEWATAERGCAGKRSPEPVLPPSFVVNCNSVGHSLFSFLILWRARLTS